MSIYGNDYAQEKVKNLLESSESIIVLSGHSGLGKYTFISSLLKELLEESDYLEVDANIAGARLARSFLKLTPIFSQFRAVVVNDAERLSFPAQDAYLKVCEEPSNSSKLIFVITDDGLFQDSLRSRFNNIVHWKKLSNVDMDEFIENHEIAKDDFSYGMCSGCPGFYNEMIGKGKYSDFSSELNGLFKETNKVLLPVPDIIKKLNKESDLSKKVVSHICRKIAVKFLGDKSHHPLIYSILRFSASLISVPSMNAELHWERILINSQM